MADNPRVSAVLWDLDGTLVDSEPLYAQLERQAMLEAGVAPAEYDEAAKDGAFSGMSTRDIFAQMLPKSHGDQAIDEVERLMDERILADVVGRSQPKRGANRVLTELPARLYRCAIVTSSRRAALEATLERFGWEWRIEVLVSADDVACRKPDPEPYELACQRLGIAPSEALAVEDSIIGITAAKAAGVRVAGVVGTMPAEALSAATWVISDLGAVPGLLGMLND